jgi:hypothetical protein
VSHTNNRNSGTFGNVCTKRCPHQPQRGVRAHEVSVWRARAHRRENASLTNRG